LPRAASDRPPRGVPRSGARIESPDNDLVRWLRRLGARGDPSLVLLEGPRVIAEAAACGVRFEVLAAREGVEEPPVAADRRVTLSQRAFAAASQTVTPQGVLAVARRPEATVADALAAARAASWPLIVLDGLQDPGNVGAICRTAAAVGAPALVVLEGGADPYGAKAVRASAGNVFRLTVGCGAWDDLEGVHGYGTSPAGGLPLELADLSGAGLLALGAEVRGLRNPGLEAVSIPMAAGVGSLNVAAAAAVLLYEVRRRLAA
jgi:TrmH family RNA methyltransferase